MINIEQAANTVTRICGITDVQEALEVTDWLLTYKGVTPSLSDFYRPYYVIGWYFWLLPENNLIKGEGATFDQNFEVARRYLLKQQTIDLAENLTIPEAYTAQALLDKLKPDTTTCDNTFGNVLGIMGF
jgi:hypothetical protein